MLVFSTILNKVQSKLSLFLSGAEKSIYAIRVKKKANPQRAFHTARTESSEDSPPKMQTSKARTLLKATLQTDVQFKESMRVYLQKTQGMLPRYKNRLHFNSSEQMWDVVDKMRQCRSCGQILVSMNREVKLMSCGGCRNAHYCHRECQKRDWKLAHKLVCGATPFTKNLEASYLCVRILSIMTVSGGPSGASASSVVLGKADILNSHFSFEKKDALSLNDDAFAAEMRINHDDNPVCNHFRQKRESNRILFPIWDTCTDNLAFVPISFDFMMGSGTPMGSVADAHVRKNFQNYSVCVECADADKRIVLPVATFVKVCEIDWEL